MAEDRDILKTKSGPALTDETLSPGEKRSMSKISSASSAESTSSTHQDKSDVPASLSRNISMSDMNLYQEDWEVPPENVTFFDALDNLALPTMLENWQTKIARQTEKVRRQQALLKSSTTNAKDRVFEEWRKRLPSPDDQLDRYMKRVRGSVDRFGSRWNDAKAVTAREKLSFIAGVLNVFVSGYLVGGRPDLFYYWFTAQLCYFMPIRYWTYRKRGYHYFLADMCYFVNLLLLLSIWVAPQSKRLFIGTYCLANGNNAIAIAMWRNSMVFHSLDKVTSLFIHIMPCVTLHCLVHLTPKAIQETRFPGLYAIKYNSIGSHTHYSLVDMILCSSVPYAIWQLAYHRLITVRRREKIAAGRPTSFTWLRKSYGNSFIGKTILGLPETLHEPAFMLIQYLYAVGTMVACPIWFWHRWPSAIFLLSLFSWSVYNGATYYIDIFGNRFQKELEQLKKDVAKYHATPDGPIDPGKTPKDGNIASGPRNDHDAASKQPLDERSESDGSIDRIPMSDGMVTATTQINKGNVEGFT